MSRMTPEKALDVLREALEHVPDHEAAPADEALYTLRQMTFDLRSPDPRDPDTHKVVRIMHFVEVPRDARIEQTISAFYDGAKNGGNADGVADGITSHLREMRVTDPVPEVIVIGGGVRALAEAARREEAATGVNPLAKGTPGDD